jgi:hypothetical protein
VLFHLEKLGNFYLLNRTQRLVETYNVDLPCILTTPVRVDSFV